MGLNTNNRVVNIAPNYRLEAIGLLPTYNGNGYYAYVDTLDEVEKIFDKELATLPSPMIVIALVFDYVLVTHVTHLSSA